MSITQYYTVIDSPLGPLTLIGSSKGLSAILYDAHQKASINFDDYERNDKLSLFAKTELQLSEYFRGERTDFDIPLDMQGSDFQIKVWKQLKKIPFGSTCSYGDIAHRIKSPKSSRAVGMANGKNPISIIVPCHRVIGSNGTLTGYAGGLDKKKYLLNLECVIQ